MENSYGTYLEKICSLMKKKFLLAEQRQGGVCEPKLLERIRSEGEQLYRMEEEAVSKKEFWPFAHLLYLWEWSELERHVAFLLFFQEACPDARRACSSLNENAMQDYVIWQTAVKTFEQPLPDSDSVLIFSQHSLFFQIFLKAPDKTDALRMDERIFYFVTGRNSEYPPYSGWLQTFSSMQDSSPLSSGREKLLQSVCRVAESDSAKKCVCQIYGGVGIGKKTFLKSLSYALNTEIVLLRMKGEREHSSSEGDIWWRECFLWRAIPALEAKGEQAEKLLREILKKVPFVLLLSEEKSELTLEDGVVISFCMEEYLAEENERAWEQIGEAYYLEEDVILEELRGKFNLLPGQIKKAYAMADLYRQIQGKKKISSAMLHEACRELLNTAWGKKAQKLDSVWSWEDIVLPEEQKKRLRIACNQVRYRNKVYSDWKFGKMVPYGRGVSILLSGPPGTGKTMAAQIVASELCMEMYRISIPSVVSKYIGETEKNLDEIFEQAKKSQVILFFDEADVLFSKRTEVKDSNDKYNNMEAAFLLQKMEEYEGVTLLATNYLKNFDEAFKRRIKFIVDFPFPDAASREKIWRKLVPDFMDTSQIDFEYLSEHFELSGSHIKNIVLYAVFLVAESGEALGMNHILEGIRNEYYKLGKILTEEEAAEYAMLLEW